MPSPLDKDKLAGAKRIIGDGCRDRPAAGRMRIPPERPELGTRAEHLSRVINYYMMRNTAVVVGIAPSAGADYRLTALSVRGRSFDVAYGKRVRLRGATE